MTPEYDDSVLRFRARWVVTASFDGPRRSASGPSRDRYGTPTADVTRGRDDSARTGRFDVILAAAALQRRFGLISGSRSRELLSF